MPALMTSWIWYSLPAVMLDKVQEASFWMLFLWWRNRAGNMERAPALITAWVCSSVPVTMLPMERSEGVCGKKKKKMTYTNTHLPIASLYKSTTFHQLTTMESSPDPNSFTSWGTTPVCTTTSILSLGPSVRYEMAQQVSASTSLSSWCRRRISVGSICFTASRGGAGFLLRHRFDRVQVTFLR